MNGLAKPTKFTNVTISLVVMAVAGWIVPSRAFSAVEEHSIARPETNDGKVVIEARNARVPLVIESLAKRFDFRIHGKPASRIERISGTVKGTLRQVLARLLHGVNYVLVTKNGAPARLVFYATPKAPPRVVRKNTPPAGIRHLREKQASLIAVSQRYRLMSQRMSSKNPQYARRLIAQAERLEEHARSIAQQLSPARR